MIEKVKYQIGFSTAWKEHTAVWKPVLLKSLLIVYPKLQMGPATTANHHIDRRASKSLPAFSKTPNIPFGYEDALYIPQKYTGSRRDRTWHPDFYLHDSGVIVEYVGMPDDEEYMEGIERKKEVYDKMGVTVIWLYPEDLWEQTTDHKYGKLRADAKENVLSKIGEVKCLRW